MPTKEFGQFDLDGADPGEEPADASGNSVLDGIKNQAIDEGHEETSQAFEKRVRQLKVAECRARRGHNSCTECSYYDYCDLVKLVMREHRGLTEDK